jgi:erythromycin esterase
MKAFLFIAVFLIPVFLYSQNDQSPIADLDRLTIVALGEEGHGYESINRAKADFLKLLHAHQFNAVLFESSFTLAAVSFLNRDSLDLRMQNFLYPFWITASVKEGLKPFWEEEKKAEQPFIFGFDLQEDCRFTGFSHYLLNRRLIIQQKEELTECDSILSPYIGKETVRKSFVSQAELHTLLRNYELVQQELASNFKKPTVESELLKHCLHNRMLLCSYLAMERGRMHYRDSIMATNVLWLKKELYPNQKTVLWAADLHIKKSEKETEWMGEWIANEMKEEYGAIAFRNGNGPGEQFANYTIERPKGKDFDLIVHVGKKVKISREEWITPCEKF